MKKLLSIVLSVVLIVSCATAGFTSGVSAAGPVTVSTSVETQNGLTGGVITTNSSIAAQSGDSVTVSAKPYYGNGFEGWYDGTTRVSTDAHYTFTASQTVSLVAKFDIKNQIVDGDYEVGCTATADTYNAFPKYSSSYYGTVFAADTPLADSGSAYGEYCLKAVPKQASNASKQKSLVNIPVKVEQGKTYLWRFSFVSLSESYNASIDYLTFSIDKAKSNGRPDWAHTENYGFHFQKSSKADYDSAIWAGGNALATASYTSNNGFSSNSEWIDMDVIFTASATGDYFLTLGTPAACMNSFAFDNMSFSETEKNGTPTAVSATSGGSVSYYKGNEAAYICTVSRGQAVNDNTDFANPYYQKIYQNYYAKADRGYIFDGWYQGNTKISDNAMLTAYALDGNYQAKFVPDNNKYQITVDVAEQDGRFGGYIIGDKTYSDMLSGEEIKLTAASYKGNTFEGWYENGSKISSDSSYTYSIYSDADIVAKFNINNLFKDSGFENTAVAASVWGSTDEWYTALPTSGMNGSVLSNNAFSGNNSANISCRNNFIAHKAMDVTANKVYSLSFSYRTSHKDATSGLAGVEVTNAVTGAVIASDTTFVPSAEEGVWQKFDLCFNTSTATSVIIKIKYTASSDATLYLDDMTLFDTTGTPFIINASTNSEDGIYPGYITCNSTQKSFYGNSTTVSVVGYADNIFKGWYDEGVLMSTDLTYTFSANAYRNLVAVFEKHNLMPDSGFENYPPNVDLSAVDDNVWFVVESTRSWNSNITVRQPSDAAEKAKTVHSGDNSLWVTHRNNGTRTIVSGLRENTDYAFSFWWKNDSLTATSELTSVSIKGKKTAKVLGIGNSQAATSDFQQQIVSFNSGTDTSIEITILYTASAGPCYIDDMELYECSVVTVIPSDGGTFNATKSGPCKEGESVTVTAVPDVGNTFLGWYDYKNPSVCYSTNPVFNFTVEKSMYLIPYFEGATAEPINYFVDGSFENGIFSPVKFASKTYETDWCTAVASTGNGSSITPSDGAYCLKMVAQYRNGNFIVDNLKPNTDYTLSLDWNSDKQITLSTLSVLPYMEEWESRLDQDTLKNVCNDLLYPDVMGIYSNATGFAVIKEKGNERWHNEQITFNSGNRTSVVIDWAYDRDAGTGSLYFDNISITEGNRGYTKTLVNGDFNTATAADGWNGAETRTSAGNSFGYVASKASQNITLDRFSGYTLKFKARSDNAASIIYGLTFGGQTELTTKNAMTNVSYNTAALSSEWNEYTLNFQSIGRPQCQLFFSSQNSADFQIDDVTLARATDVVPVQKITFEDSENKIIINSYFRQQARQNDTWFSYYRATDASDKNVHSGEYSLLMKKGANSVGHELAQEWSEIKVQSGKTYTVSFWAMATDAATSFTAKLNTLDVDWNWVEPYNETLSLNKGEWKKFEITFTLDNIEKTAANRVFFILDGAGDSTTSDIYFDDIYMTEAPAAIYDRNPANLYTTDTSHNYFDNFSFEKNDPLTDNYVITGDAAYDNRYIHITSGAKIIVPVTTRTDYDLAFAVDYTFAASVRGNAASAGTVGLACDATGTRLLCDTSGNPVSLDLNTSGIWKRSGYSFNEYRNVTLYLVIECTAGEFDVDYVSLFTSLHTYAEDTRDQSTDNFNYDDDSDYADMGIYDVKGTYIAGKITGLPVNSYIVLKNNEKIFKSAVSSNGSYEITNITDGSYTMFVIAGGYPFATAYGDLNISNNNFSGLACKRLSGAAIHVSGTECKNGIVKLTDEDTGYAYFTATSKTGAFNGFILNSTWDVSTSTNNEATIASYSMKLSDFGAMLLVADAGFNPATGDNSPVAALVTVMITSLAVLALCKKKGGNNR